MFRAHILPSLLKSLRVGDLSSPLFEAESPHNKLGIVVFDAESLCCLGYSDPFAHCELY